METGLPILATDADTWRTSLLLHNFNMEVPSDDEQRIEKVKEHNAANIDSDWLDTLAKDVAKTRKLSPPAFRFLLTDLARQAKKTIVLPEGNEPRTIKVLQFVVNVALPKLYYWVKEKKSNVLRFNKV